MCTCPSSSGARVAPASHDIWRPPLCNGHGLEGVLRLHMRFSPSLPFPQLLLAELEHRNIRLHEKVTGDLVHQRYKFGKLLGQGSSAAVYEATHKRSKVECAIKVIKKNGDMNDDESMATELEILKMVHHRYILNCKELFETPQCIWVVMELIRGGELLELLIEGGVYTERDAARALKQAFLAISYLHSQGVVHRDIKLQNLLLTDKERTSDLKVCDFGLSAQVVPHLDALCHPSLGLLA